MLQQMTMVTAVRITLLLCCTQCGFCVFDEGQESRHISHAQSSKVERMQLHEELMADGITRMFAGRASFSRLTFSKWFDAPSVYAPGPLHVESVEQPHLKQETAATALLEANDLECEDVIPGSMSVRAMMGLLPMPAAMAVYECECPLHTRIFSESDPQCLIQSHLPEDNGMYSKTDPRKFTKSRFRDLQCICEDKDHVNDVFTKLVADGVAQQSASGAAETKEAFKKRMASFLATLSAWAHEANHTIHSNINNLLAVEVLEKFAVLSKGHHWVEHSLPPGGGNFMAGFGVALNLYETYSASKELWGRVKQRLSDTFQAGRRNACMIMFGTVALAVSLVGLFFAIVAIIGSLGTATVAVGSITVAFAGVALSTFKDAMVRTCEGGVVDKETHFHVANAMVDPHATPDDQAAFTDLLDKNGYSSATQFYDDLKQNFCKCREGSHCTDVKIKNETVSFGASYDECMATANHHMKLAIAMHEKKEKNTFGGYDPHGHHGDHSHHDGPAKSKEVVANMYDQLTEHILQKVLWDQQLSALHQKQLQERTEKLDESASILGDAIARYEAKQAPYHEANHEQLLQEVSRIHLDKVHELLTKTHRRELYDVQMYQHLEQVRQQNSAFQERKNARDETSLQVPPVFLDMDKEGDPRNIESSCMEDFLKRIGALERGWIGSSDDPLDSKQIYIARHRPVDPRDADLVHARVLEILDGGGHGGHIYFQEDLDVPQPYIHFKSPCPGDESMRDDIALMFGYANWANASANYRFGNLTKKLISWGVGSESFDDWYADYYFGKFLTNLSSNALYHGKEFALNSFESFVQTMVPNMENYQRGDLMKFIGKSLQMDDDAAEDFAKWARRSDAVEGGQEVRLPVTGEKSRYREQRILREIASTMRPECESEDLLTTTSAAFADALPDLQQRMTDLHSHVCDAIIRRREGDGLPPPKCATTRK